MSHDKSNLSDLGGHDFESLVGELVKKMGFVVEERKLTADGGVDILARTEEPMFGGIYVIQCKRYSEKVGESVVRDLYGVVHAKNANKGILITDSTFTKAAIEFAQNKQIELVDGEKLRGLLVKHGITRFEKGAILLPNKIRFLLNSFVPAVGKIEKRVNDIKNQRVYLEKIRLNEKQWVRLLQDFADKGEGYITFLKNLIDQSFNTLMMEKEPNMQEVKNVCDKIIGANRKLVDDYERWSRIVPPPKFSLVHQKCLGVYVELFEALFRLAQDTERIATFSPDQLKELPHDSQGQARRYDVKIDLTQTGKAMDEVNSALRALNETQKAQKGCFIVTAAYGTILAPELYVLRAFRDNFMELTYVGRVIAQAYYGISPKIAYLIWKHDSLKWVVRAFTSLIIRLVRKFKTLPPIESDDSEECVPFLSARKKRSIRKFSY